MNQLLFEDKLLKIEKDSRQDIRNLKEIYEDFGNYGKTIAK
jgi:hypothetical protein